MPNKATNAKNVNIRTLFHQLKPTVFGLLIGLSLGIVLTISLYSQLSDVKHELPNTSAEKLENNQESSLKKPLYWVAPMDANYRRDKPGKSPMGMELLPVYAEGNAVEKYGKGAITIAPHIINNLGVRIAQVVKKSLHSIISTVGYVQYDQDNIVHIHPRVEGWIDSLYVKSAGDPVQKGQALYKLYSPQLVNAQEEYIIALKRNNSGLVQAAKARLIALHLPPSFIKTLERTKQVAQTVTFYAPQSGVVDGLKIREGFYVKPGTTIMSIAKLEQIWVEAEVFERDAAMIKSGLTVSMTLDYLPERIWHGVIDYVYPSLDPKTRTLRVRIKFDNEDLALKPNMFAQVDIQANAINNAIVVPKESVIRTGKQDRVVLALGEGQFKSIVVSIGRVDSEFIEITKGLTTNDMVVTSAQFLIDSESSKTSDFKRMESEVLMMPDHISSATVDGVINHINIDKRFINISRGAIEKWNREPATMDFVVADHIDLSLFHENMHVTFTFEVHDEFIIVEMTSISKPEINKQKSAHAEHYSHEDHALTHDHGGI